MVVVAVLRRRGVKREFVVKVEERGGVHSRRLYSEGNQNILA